MAWTAGLMAFIAVGAIACIIAVFPDLWVNIFTQNESVQVASRQYLSTAAPCYAFIGLASSMYFSSQGAAKMIGPVLAQTARLVFIAAGGLWLSTHGATAQNFFVLAASSMVVLGTLSCLSVILTRWGPKRTAVAVRPALSVVGE
jgi:Na+-driven multidrug efflux pump